MILIGYYLFVAFSAALALVDWRKGVLLCLVIDAVRDPLRKLVPGQPVLMTLVVGVVWLAVFAGAYTRERDRMLSLTSAYPQMRTALVLLIVALVPAGILVMVSFAGGWMPAVIGAASYLFPVAGILIGYTYARTEHDVVRFLRWYCLLAAILLMGALFEFAGLDVPALGGLRIEWFRAGWIELISGFYRSPDGLGLHAAMLMMFAAILVLRKRSKGKWFWLLLMAYAGLCLLLSGRRKMIGMPLMFVAVLMVALYARGSTTLKWSLVMTIIITCGGIYFLLGQADVPEGYTQYAATMLEASHSRVQKNILGGMRTSARQAGFLGYGLGTATQGKKYLVYQGPRTWQEDGASRLVVELGISGALCMLLAGIAVVRSAHQTLKVVHPQHRTYMIVAGLAAIACANAASFVVSHQAYSGDPSSTLIASMCLGMLLAGPRFALQSPDPERQRPQVSFPVRTVLDRPRYRLRPHGVPAADLAVE